MHGCKPLTDNELSAALLSFDGVSAPRDRALFILGVRTGFRITELLSLCVADVYQFGRVVDAVSVRRCNTKGKSSGRTVPLHREAKAALEAWLSVLRLMPGVQDTSPLFLNLKTGHKAIERWQAWNVIKNAFTAAGIAGNTGTHSMRKTFAKRIYDRSGKDLVAAKEALGHKHINSTASYLSFSNDALTSIILGDDEESA